MGKPPLEKKTESPSTEVTVQDSLQETIDRQIGDLVNQKQREQIVARVTSIMISENFSGPLPHPKHIAGYDTILPGSANRIIAMAENQQGHHIKMDQDILKAEITDRKLGMVLGAGAFAFLIICALITAILTESEIIPGLFLGTAAIGGVGLFIWGRENGN